MEQSLIDKETGEILQDMNIEEGDRLKVIKKAQLEYLAQHDMNFNKDEPFVKLYTDIIPNLKKHLTPGEFTFLICLSRYVSYEDCIIRKRPHGNCDVANIKDLSELMNMSYDATRKMLTKLCNKGVIAFVKTGSINENRTEKYNKAYVMNPFILFRGTNVNKYVVKSFFEHSGWNEIFCDIDEV